MAKAELKRIYIFGQPRTCSMLFHRLLSEPDALEDKPARDANVNGSTGATSEDSLLPKVLEIEGRNKVVCLKDHLFSLMRQDVMLSKYEFVSDRDNPTRRFSDDFLLSITCPIFFIRHPALIIRSFWDAQQTVFKLQPDEDVFMALTTLRWTSVLYNWYKRHGVDPIVVDADDVVYNTGPVMEAVFSQIGIDPAGVRYGWATQ